MITVSLKYFYKKIIKISGFWFYNSLIKTQKNHEKTLFLSCCMPYI